MCDHTSKDLLKEVFDRSDTNGNGAIDVNELVNLMRASGQTVTKREANELIGMFDKNSNGTLEFHEFVEMMKAFVEKGGHKPEMEKRRIFEMIDKNKDGVITKAELKVIMTEILDEDIPDADLDQMMKEADSNKDGVINFEEFSVLAAKMKIFNCGQSA